MSHDTEMRNLELTSNRTTEENVQKMEEHFKEKYADQVTITGKWYTQFGQSERRRYQPSNEGTAVIDYVQQYSAY